MQNEKTDHSGVPAAIAALGLAPGTRSCQDLHVCTADPEHDVVEISLVAWDPIFQRHRVTGYDNWATCNFCDGTIEKKPVSFRNAAMIATFLENTDSDLRLLDCLLSGKCREPWEKHACRQCGSTEIQGKAWSIYDPVEQSHEILSYLSGPNHDRDTCSSCGEKDTRLIAMSNHEILITADRMRGELARLTAQRAEIDGWLAVHGHIYGWAPPG